MTDQDDKAKTEKTVTEDKDEATEKPEVKTKAKHKPKAKPAKPAAAGSGVATSLAILALLIAAGSAAGGYYLWTLQQAGAGARQQALQDMGTQAASLQEGLQARLAEQNGQLESRLQVEQKARVEMEKNLEQLHTELGRDRHAWTLAEVRYYLRLANTRLLLLSDVASALRALELADARLKALASPSLHKLRGLLSDEIAALKTVPKVDSEGASLSLIALARQVEALPMLAPTQSETSAETRPVYEVPADIWDWRGHARAIWTELKTLVTIRRIDRPVDALLAPEQTVYLRHNLRLKLEAARLALLQKDAVVYQASLTEASEWVAAYFNRDSAPVKALLEQLAALAALELQPALPDISRSLLAVEALEEQQAKSDGGN